MDKKCLFSHFETKHRIGHCFWHMYANRLGGSEQNSKQIIFVTLNFWISVLFEVYAWASLLVF